MLGIRGTLMSLAPLRVRTIALSVAVLGASLAGPTTLLAAQGPQAPAPDPGQPAAGHQQATPAPPAASARSWSPDWRSAR